jgi:hypothetical protein
MAKVTTDKKTKQTKASPTPDAMPRTAATKTKKAAAGGGKKKKGEFALSAGLQTNPDKDF